MRGIRRSEMRKAERRKADGYRREEKIVEEKGIGNWA